MRGFGKADAAVRPKLAEYRIETPEAIGDLPELGAILRAYLTSASDALVAIGGPTFDIDHQVALTVDNIARYLPPHGYTFLARSPEGALHGMACLKMIRADVAEIKRLYVRPAARGMGLGRQMMDGVVARAHALGAQELYLDTVRSMEAAIAMYRRMGFQPIERYPESENPPDVWPFAIYLGLRL